MKTPDDAVYLASISLENVLCFAAKQSLDFTLEGGGPARWTIVLGDNGMGKTTLLQVAAGFSPEQSQNGGKASVNSYWGSDERLGRMQRASAYGITVGATFSIGACLGEPAPDRRDRSIKVQGFGAPGSDAYGRIQDYPQEVRNLACFAYGATRRIDRAAKLSRSPDSIGTASLFNEAAQLIDPVEWLLQTDYAAAKAESTSARDFWNWRLYQVKQTLIEILPDVTAIRIQGPGADSRDQPPEALFQTPFGEIPFERMGLGYRTMVAWIVDLAARMFRQYPDSPNPIAEPAIVLVDEIDLHLHPTWQRRLLSWLSERFVNTQFIATAHSPLVVQAASDAKLAVLRREGDHVVIDQSLQAVTGWRVDQILTSDLFGLPTARPPEFDQVVAERTRILSKQRIDLDDEARLRALDEKMAEMPTGENPEDMAARDIIRRAARLLNTKGSAPDDPHS